MTYLGLSDKCPRFACKRDISDHTEDASELGKLYILCKYRWHIKTHC